VSAPDELSPADIEAIRRLIADFHLLIDHGRARECIDFFAPGARLVFGPGSPNPGEIEGLDAILDFLTARQAAPVTTRHLLGAARIAANRDGTASSSSLLLLFKAPGTADPLVPAAVADLDESYVRTPDGWKLSVRQVRPVSWT
jgi:hypothetical protein